MSNEPLKILLCDFCANDKEQLTLVPCNSFNVEHAPGNIPMTSPDGWFACPACLVFVQQGDREQLFQRSKQCWIDKYGEWDDRVDPYLRAFQNQFWENKQDPATSPEAEKE